MQKKKKENLKVTLVLNLMWTHNCIYIYFDMLYLNHVHVIKHMAKVYFRLLRQT